MARKWLLVLVLGMLGAGCATGGTQPQPEPGQQRGRVLLQFAPEHSGTFTADFLAGLDRTVQGRVGYVRPLSGGWHLLVVEGVAPALAASRLEARPDVVHAEVDRRLPHQRDRAEDAP